MLNTNSREDEIYELILLQRRLDLFTSAYDPNGDLKLDFIPKTDHLSSISFDFDDDDLKPKTMEQILSERVDRFITQGKSIYKTVTARNFHSLSPETRVNDDPSKVYANLVYVVALIIAEAFLSFLLDVENIKRAFMNTMNVTDDEIGSNILRITEQIETLKDTILWANAKKNNTTTFLARPLEKCLYARFKTYDKFGWYLRSLKATEHFFSISRTSTQNLKKKTTNTEVTYIEHGAISSTVLQRLFFDLESFATTFAYVLPALWHDYSSFSNLVQPLFSIDSEGMNSNDFNNMGMGSLKSWFDRNSLEKIPNFTYFVDHEACYYATTSFDWRLPCFENLVLRRSPEIAMLVSLGSTDINLENLEKEKGYIASLKYAITMLFIKLHRSTILLSEEYGNKHPYFINETTRLEKNHGFEDAVLLYYLGLTYSWDFPSLNSAIEYAEKSQSSLPSPSVTYMPSASSSPSFSTLSSSSVPSNINTINTSGKPKGRNFIGKYPAKNLSQCSVYYDGININVVYSKDMKDGDDNKGDDDDDDDYDDEKGGEKEEEGKEKDKQRGRRKKKEDKLKKKIKTPKLLDFRSIKITDSIDDRSLSLRAVKIPKSAFDVKITRLGGFSTINHVEITEQVKLRDVTLKLGIEKTFPSGDPSNASIFEGDLLLDSGDDLGGYTSSNKRSRQLKFLKKDWLYGLKSLVGYENQLKQCTLTINVDAPSVLEGFEETDKWILYSLTSEEENSDIALNFSIPYVPASVEASHRVESKKAWYFTQTLVQNSDKLIEKICFNANSALSRRTMRLNYSTVRVIPRNGLPKRELTSISPDNRSNPVYYNKIRSTDPGDFGAKPEDNNEDIFEEKIGFNQDSREKFSSFVVKTDPKCFLSSTNEVSYRSAVFTVDSKLIGYVMINEDQVSDWSGDSPIYLPIRNVLVAKLVSESKKDDIAYKTASRVPSVFKYVNAYGSEIKSFGKSFLTETKYETLTLPDFVVMASMSDYELIINKTEQGSTATSKNITKFKLRMSVLSDLLTDKNTFMILVKAKDAVKIEYKNSAGEFVSYSMNSLENSFVDNTPEAKFYTEFLRQNASVPLKCFLVRMTNPDSRTKKRGESRVVDLEYNISLHK